MARLPPLNALKCFEAAARGNSFSRAADELHVTQSAISHQIRQLEDWFGVARKGLNQKMIYFPLRKMKTMIK